jgi:hypothetical protein
MKHPPTQMLDSDAKAAMEQFIAQSAVMQR